MDAMGLGIEILMLFLITLLFILYFNVKKSISIQDDMTVNSTEVQYKTKKQKSHTTGEKDHNFRVNISEECVVELIDFENPKFNVLKGKKFKGTIEDISIDGLRIKCHYNLPIKDRISVLVHFEIRKQKFQIKGVLIKKVEYNRKNICVYVLKINNLGYQEEQRLFGLLTQLQSERKMRN